MAIIYKIQFPNGKTYIGFTSFTLKKRIGEHLNAANNGSAFLVHKAIRKYGADNLKWTILEEHEDVEYLLKIRETQWIFETNSHFTENGYNMTLGGEGTFGYNWRDQKSDDFLTEYADRMRLKSIELWTNDEFKEKQRISRIESWDNEDRKEKHKERLSVRWAKPGAKEELSIISSERMKQRWAAGEFDYDHCVKASLQAKEKIIGSKWYNDGVRTYRLQPTDPIILEKKLKLGKKL